MTRLSGIRVLILSFVLWALAVWIFSAPRPAATETAAEETTEPGTGADEAVRAEATITPSSTTPAKHDPASPPNPDTEGASPRTGPIRTVEAETVPAAPAATGGGSQITRAPITPAPTGGGSPATTPTVSQAPDIVQAGGEPAATGAPITSPTSPASNAGSRQGNAAYAGVDAGTPPASARMAPWRLEPPIPRSPPPARPPARSGGPAVGDGAIAGQLNAARRAAWEGRLTDALVHYYAAARVQPKSHVVWGEMGNVLWAMGRWPEAAYALEGAATLLVDAGEFGAANALLPAVRDIDPSAAQRVQQRLWAASQRRPG